MGRPGLHPSTAAGQSKYNHIMLSPGLEEGIRRIRFRDEDAARTRLDDLAGDEGELLTLERHAPERFDSLEACPDPDPRRAP